MRPTGTNVTDAGPRATVVTPRPLPRTEIALAVFELRLLRLRLHLCVVADTVRRAGHPVTLAALARYVDPAVAQSLPVPAPVEGEPDWKGYFANAPAPPDLDGVRRALRRLADDPEIARRFERAIEEGRDACGPLAGVLIEATANLKQWE